MRNQAMSAISRVEKGKEIRLGESKYCLSDDNIIQVSEVGKVDNNKAIIIKELAHKFIRMSTEKVSILVDLNRTGKPSADARKNFHEINEHEKVNKVAFFGMHPVAKVIASFLIGISQKKDIRFFKTREDALVWLKE